MDKLCFLILGLVASQAICMNIRDKRQTGKSANDMDDRFGFNSPNNGNNGPNRFSSQGLFFPGQDMNADFTGIPYPNQGWLPNQQQFPNQGQFPNQQQFPNQGQFPNQQQFPNQGQFPNQQQFSNPGQFPNQQPFPIQGQFSNQQQSPNLEQFLTQQQLMYLRNLLQSQQFPNPEQLPNQQTSSTTVAPNIGETTTVAPSIKLCADTCPATPEYNPVCGTDKVTYTNMGKLICARTCGVSVQLAKRSPC